MPKQYVVQLRTHPRSQLSALMQKGHASARTIRRAQTLLLADEGQPAATSAATRQTATATVTLTCKRVLTAGLEAALDDRPRPGGRRQRDGRQEAPLVALACSAPPTGRAHWSLRLLADRVVDVGIVAALSSATGRRVRKKTRCSPGSRSRGVSPPPVPSSSPGWKTCAICTRSRMIPSGRVAASMSAPANGWAMARSPCPWCRVLQNGSTMNTPGMAPVTCLA
jgi:hypothetical protein